MSNKIAPLDPELFRWRCDPKHFSFKSTDEILPIGETIGQERAMKALDLGLSLKSYGYNIYALGESGTGKTSSIKTLLQRRADSEKTPDDWCYLFNFVTPDCPKSVSLPAGKGSEFRSDMEGLIDSLRKDIPKVFESKDYEQHRDDIFTGQQVRTKAILSRLEQNTSAKGFILKRGAGGLSIVPAKDGKPLEKKDFEEMTREEHTRIETDSRFLHERMNYAIREMRTIEKDSKGRISALNREVIQYVVNPLIKEMSDKYHHCPKLSRHLESVRQDILMRVDEFIPKEDISIPLPWLKAPHNEDPFGRYVVNLIVDNGDTKGAPVVIETNPTYNNLFGRIEYKFQYGVAITDFTMIKGGAVHKANGGYLVLDAIDILRNVFVYDAVKRMIKNREVRIEDIWEQFRAVSATALKPEPLTLDIKIIIKGDPAIYYLLYNHDDEYRKLFKVKSDFDNQMPLNEENIEKYTFFVSARCREDGLLPFDRSGVAGIIEQSLRISGDREKLSARFGVISDLIKEASYWASQSEAESVSYMHLKMAIKEKRYRNSRIEEKIRDMIKEGTFLIDTEGAVTGQINGIAVLDFGDYIFGKPSRITARTFVGETGIVNIERAVKMSGRIHNKALMILTSYLGDKFACDTPMTLAASVCFEQLYDEVEGDSATCTEFYALISSISSVPLKQGFAVTGSMNQLGEVQPVGAINEKIEGFFDVCSAKGLTGQQGMIIPQKNLRNLMLREEIVEAAGRGEFRIYPIEHVDEGIEILTGMPAGEAGSNGMYPEGSVNRLVDDKLKELAGKMKSFGKGIKKKRSKKGS